MGKDNESSEAKKVEKKIDKIERVSNDAGKKLSSLGDTISGSVASMLSSISAASHGAAQGGQNEGGGEEDSGAVPTIPTEGIDQFNASLAAASETMAVSMIPSINDMVNGSLLPMVGQFVSLNPQVQGFVDNLALAAPSIGATISTLGEMSTTIGGAIGSVQGMAEGVKSFGSTLGTIFGSGGTMVLVIAAIAALVAGFLYLWNTNEEFRTAVLEIWENIKNMAMEVFGYLAEWWKENSDAIFAVLTGAWELIKSTLSTVWQTIKKVAIEVFGALSKWWKENSENVKAVISGAWELIKNTLSTVWEAISKVAKTVFDNLKAFWDQWGGTITSVFQTIWSTISKVFDAALKVLSGCFQVFAGIFEGDWQKVWEGMKGIFGGVWEAIEAIFSGVWEGIKEIFTGGINFVIEKLNGFIRKINSLSIKIPEITLPNGETIGGYTLGFNIPEIPLLAKGGIVTGPTLAMIGEAGKEAVIPLNKLNSMIQPTIDQGLMTYLKDNNAKSDTNITIHTLSPYEAATAFRNIDEELRVASVLGF